MITQFVNISFL